MVKGKVDEAKKVLCYAAEVNKKTIPLNLLNEVRSLGPGVRPGLQTVGRPLSSSSHGILVYCFRMMATQLSPACQAREWPALGDGQALPGVCGQRASWCPVSIGWSCCLVAAAAGKEGEEGLDPGLPHQSVPFQGGLDHGLCVVSCWGWLQTQERHGGWSGRRPGLSLSFLPHVSSLCLRSMPPTLNPSLLSSSSPFSSFPFFLLSLLSLSYCSSHLSILLLLSLSLAFFVVLFQVFHQLQLFHTEPQVEGLWDRDLPHSNNPRHSGGVGPAVLHRSTGEFGEKVYPLPEPHSGYHLVFLPPFPYSRYNLPGRQPPVCSLLGLPSVSYLGRLESTP